MGMAFQGLIALKADLVAWNLDRTGD